VVEGRGIRNMVCAMRLAAVAAPLLLILFAGCLSVKTDPIEVKPIHITVDVNVKVDKALKDFFGDMDRKSSGS